MATLINNQTQQRHLLQSHHSFGRLQCSVDTQISDAYISKVHAFIEWNEKHWILWDVSSNGTWVNGKKLVRDKVAHLQQGDTITFASKSGNAFTVHDINPPCDCLIPVEHEGKAIELEYFHVLPAKQSQPVVLSYNNQTYSWWQEKLDDNVEQASVCSELTDREIVVVDGLSWQLQINRCIADTQILRPTLTSLDQLTLNFQVSLDEESTHLTMESDDQCIDLLVRSHHYLTLTLARQRFKDIEAGVDESEQGWIYAELLAKDLGIDPSHLNIQIYRIRKQFVDALNNSCDSSELIQRSVGKLRLASKYFRIVKGDALECDSSQDNHYHSSTDGDDQLNEHSYQ